MDITYAEEISKKFKRAKGVRESGRILFGKGEGEKMFGFGPNINTEIG
jgi:hypothetical protein